MRPRRSLPVALAACLALASCIRSVTSPGVMLATDPPGARVLLDGRDTGFATPCHLELDLTRVQEVAFTLEGYREASRTLRPAETWTVVPWRDGDMRLSTWRFPIFLTFGGFLFPFRVNEDLAPSRIFVPLEVATED